MRSNEQKEFSELIKGLFSNDIGLDLSSNLDHDTLMEQLILYRFTEKETDVKIPENQFGLGYQRIISMLASIINYIDSHSECYADQSQSQLFLILIEEPESFLHPQLQEIFIQKISELVKTIIHSNGNDSSLKIPVYCQIVLSTHSPHILNTKIQSSNTFNNVNYMLNKVGGHSIALSDDNIISDLQEDQGLHILTFIKKTFKFKIAEMFFADAVIFVEGVTEENLLHYYLYKMNLIKNFILASI